MVGRPLGIPPPHILTNLDRLLWSEVRLGQGPSDAAMDASPGRGAAPVRRPARFLLRERDASNAKEASDGAQYLGVPLSASAHAAERSAHGIMVVLRLRVGMGVHGVPKATATLLTARLASLTNGQSNPNRISSHIRFATVMATPTRAPPVAEAAVRVRVCVGSAGFVSVSARPRLPRGFQMGSVGIGALGLGPGVGRAVGPAVGPRIGPGGSPGGGPGVDTPTAPSLTCGVEGCGGHRQRRSFSVSPAAAPAMPAPTATPRGGNSLNLGCSDCQSTQSAASSSVGSSVSSTPRTTGVTTWVGGGGVGGGAGGGAAPTPRIFPRSLARSPLGVPPPGPSKIQQL